MINNVQEVHPGTHRRGSSTGVENGHHSAQHPVLYGLLPRVSPLAIRSCDSSLCTAGV